MLAKVINFFKRSKQRSKVVTGHLVNLVSKQPITRNNNVLYIPAGSVVNVLKPVDPEHHIVEVVDFENVSDQELYKYPFMTVTPGQHVIVYDIHMQRVYDSHVTCH